MQNSNFFMTCNLIKHLGVVFSSTDLHLFFLNGRYERWRLWATVLWEKTGTQKKGWEIERVLHNPRLPKKEFLKGVLCNARLTFHVESNILNVKVWRLVYKHMQYLCEQYVDYVKLFSIKWLIYMYTVKIYPARPVTTTLIIMSLIPRNNVPLEILNSVMDNLKFPPGGFHTGP